MKRWSKGGDSSKSNHPKQQEKSEFNDAIETLRATLLGAYRNHKSPDAILYNFGIPIALVATTAATVVPSPIWAKSLSAAATVIIAISRAMGFGSRWRWHWEMKMKYQALIDRTDEVELLPLPHDEKLDRIKNIYDQLEDLRKSEGDIPGTTAEGTAS
jgi:hypothetical protein